MTKYSIDVILFYSPKTVKFQAIGVFFKKGSNVHSAVTWSAPGTTNPESCDIFEIMIRSARGESTTASEVFISFHYLPESLVIEIANHLSHEKRVMFRKICAVDPTQFQRRKWWQFFAKPRLVTWRDYANHLGFVDDESWWDACSGISHEVQSYLRARNHSS